MHLGDFSVVNRYAPPRIATLEGYDGGCNCFGQAPEGGAITTTASAIGISPAKAVALGVTTGVLVWFITRWLSGRR